MLLYNCSKGTKRKKFNVVAVARRQEGESIMTTEKFCTRCGKKFVAVGREVICPTCKQAAAEESKRAAVERAKRASWNGESVPVRISGRASTLIRKYGEANYLSFAESLDALLKASDYFKSVGATWEDVEPYKSHRRDKSTATSMAATSMAATSTTETAQDTASKPQDAPQEVKQAAKASRAKASRAKASRAKASK